MAIIDHLFIIRALMLRDLRLRLLYQPSGFIVDFLRPSLACGVHYFIFRAIGKTMPPGISLEEFIWPAIVVWLTIIQSYQAQQRPLRTFIFPGVSQMHLRLAMCVWPTVVNLSFYFISVAIMIIYGDNVTFPNIPLTTLVFFIAVALGFGLGLLVHEICRAIPLVEPLFHLVPYFMFLGAGIYYCSATAPPILAQVFLYSPILHLSEYARYAFNPGYPITFVSLSYPSLWAVGVVLAGLALSRRLRYKPAA